MTIKTPEQIANEVIAVDDAELGAQDWDEQYLTDTHSLHAYLVRAIQADRAQRDLAEAWREGYQAGYENGYDGLYGHADNPYE